MKRNYELNKITNTNNRIEQCRQESGALFRLKMAASQSRHSAISGYHMVRRRPLATHTRHTRIPPDIRRWCLCVLQHGVHFSTELYACTLKNTARASKMCGDASAHLCRRPAPSSCVPHAACRVLRTVCLACITEN